MTFQEALKILGIEDYGERIFQSNSHGELFHLQQYFNLAETFEKNPPTPADCFRTWFVELVNYAEKHWDRPESVFQHISKILIEDLEKCTAQ